MSEGANTPLDARTQFSELGPATQVAIRTGDSALKGVIGDLERKSQLGSLNSIERRYYEKELRENQDALRKLWSQPYQRPYEPARRNANQASRNGDMPG